MKSKIISLLLILFFCFATSATLACWAPPADEVWGASPDKSFIYHRNNLTGEITIYQANTPENIVWQTKLTGFNSLFSTVLLSDQGNILIHIRGNHQIQNRNDLAIQLIKADGTIANLPVKVFIDRLVPPPQPLISTAPGKMWMNRIEAFSTDSLTLINAKGDLKIVSFEKVSFVAPATS
ncbi:hypothetical protein P3T73_02365 [Kiritimatiellota bacterium B12222]|nr:hypothetical protein P3T73_02365 [Kiritimatiellota bacterium B12222]